MRPRTKAKLRTVVVSMWVLMASATLGILTGMAIIRIGLWWMFEAH